MFGTTLFGNIFDGEMWESDWSAGFNRLGTGAKFFYSKIKPPSGFCFDNSEDVIIKVAHCNLTASPFSPEITNAIDTPEPHNVEDDDI